jgi:hypothetical protein
MSRFQQLTIVKAANSYWEETTGEHFFCLPGTAWIRLSTGKLCIDVGDGYDSIAAIALYVPWLHSELPEVKLTENDLGDKLIYTLELDEFYSLLTRGNIGFLNFSSSTPGTIMLPSIRSPYGDPAHFHSNELCAIPTAKNFTHNDSYIDSWHTDDLPQAVLPPGWTRCAYGYFAPSCPNNCSVGLIIQSVTQVCSGSA